MNHQAWSPYGGSSSIILAVVLLIATGVLIYFAMRLQHPLAVKRPGKVLRVFLVVIWVVFVATLLEAWSIYVLALYRQVGSLTAPVNPIAPVTMISGVVAFFVIAYLARRRGFWDAVRGNLSFTYTGHTGAVLGVAWSPDDKRIASTSIDTTVHVWNAADGGDVYIYGGHSDFVITPAWSPDGKRIASSSSDSTVQVWSPW